MIIELRPILPASIALVSNAAIASKDQLGVAVGPAVRVRATCSISGSDYQFAPVSIDSIAQFSEVSGAVVQ